MILNKYLPSISESYSTSSSDSSCAKTQSYYTDTMPLGGNWGYLTPTLTYTNLALAPIPKKVGFYPPRTVVYWEDGTKTVVMCNEDDVFNKQFGYLMAFYEKTNDLSKKKTKELLKNAIGDDKK